MSLLFVVSFSSFLSIVMIIPLPPSLPPSLPQARLVGFRAHVAHLRAEYEDTMQGRGESLPPSLPPFLPSSLPPSLPSFLPNLPPTLSTCFLSPASYASVSYGTPFSFPPSLPPPGKIARARRRKTDKEERMAKKDREMEAIRRHEEERLKAAREERARYEAECEARCVLPPSLLPATRFPSLPSTVPTPDACVSLSTHSPSLPLSLPPSLRARAEGAFDEEELDEVADDDDYGPSYRCHFPPSLPPSLLPSLPSSLPSFLLFLPPSPILSLPFPRS